MQLSKQAGFSESEDVITSDILRIAGKISRKIERKQRKHRSRKTNETDDFTTQDSTGLACFQYPDSGMPSSKKRKSKQENKSSDMSPSEKEEMFSPPQIEELEGVTSPKKRKKHKLPEEDKSESVTDNGVSSSNASHVFSPKKRKQTESESRDSSVSSRKKKKKDATCDSRENINERDKDSSVVSSGDHGSDKSEGKPKQKKQTAAQLHKFRFQRKGFQQVDVSSTVDPVLSENLAKNKDFWLIKAPSDFDITSLNEKTVSLTDRVIELDLPDQKCDLVVSHQPSELCPLISNQSTGHLQQGGSFGGQLQIIGSIDVPPVPPIQVPPRKEHTIPECLKQRYVPFGADIPVKSSPSKKKKKHKKDHKESTEEDHKKQKKKKRKKS
ncbi:uncharacterized protein LOC133187888 [Saccostrea echinata]|uniref:uncharacterized protein LOC133187888 n=1 Tax=Saccostrea echinata TaxID=191078 RepID=UPI002A80B471|nr:uncharacterized protein LOC133187888 [Saccostrea echinata]